MRSGKNDKKPTEKNNFRFFSFHNQPWMQQTLLLRHTKEKHFGPGLYVVVLGSVPGDNNASHCCSDSPGRVRFDAPVLFLSTYCQCGGRVFRLMVLYALPAQAEGPILREAFFLGGGGLRILKVAGPARSFVCRREEL